jgi:hypothetical protein
VSIVEEVEEVQSILNFYRHDLKHHVLSAWALAKRSAQAVRLSKHLNDGKGKR